MAREGWFDCSKNFTVDQAMEFVRKRSMIEDVYNHLETGLKPASTFNLQIASALHEFVGDISTSSVDPTRTRSDQTSGYVPRWIYEIMGGS